MTASSYHTASGLGMGRVIHVPAPPREIFSDVALLDFCDREGSASTCGAAKVGAVIVTKNGGTVGGHNGAPPHLPTCEEAGCIAIPATETTREYSRHLHAEAAAILAAAKWGEAINGRTMYVSGRDICYSCGLLIIGAGIATVVIRPPAPGWMESVGAMLEAGGVTVRTVEA